MVEERRDGREWSNGMQLHAAPPPPPAPAPPAPPPPAAPHWLGNCHWVISTHPPSHLINWRTQVAKCTECATDRLHDAHMRGVGKSLLSYLLHLANGFVHRQKCLLCMLPMQSIWAQKERHKHFQLVDSSTPALASVHQNGSPAPLQSIQVLPEAHALKPNAHPTKLFKFRYPLLSVECQFQCTATAIFPLLAILYFQIGWNLERPTIVVIRSSVLPAVLT